MTIWKPRNIYVNPTDTPEKPSKTALHLLVVEEYGLIVKVSAQLPLLPALESLTQNKVALENWRYNVNNTEPATVIKLLLCISKHKYKVQQC